MDEWSIGVMEFWSDGHLNRKAFNHILIKEVL